MPLSGLDPILARWFTTTLGAPTEPQIQGWPLIRDRRDVLISAPTGSGKTLAAFSITLDRLIRQARTGMLPDETQVVYVSPLKALSDDIRKNLENSSPLGAEPLETGSQSVNSQSWKTSFFGFCPALEAWTPAVSSLGPVRA